MSKKETVSKTAEKAKVENKPETKKSVLDPVVEALAKEGTVDGATGEFAKKDDTDIEPLKVSPPDADNDTVEALAKATIDNEIAKTRAEIAKVKADTGKVASKPVATEPTNSSDSRIVKGKGNIKPIKDGKYIRKGEFLEALDAIDNVGDDLSFYRETASKSGRQFYLFDSGTEFSFVHNMIGHEIQFHQ